MRANPNETLPVVEDTFVPVGSLVTVCIGRNVGDVPMTESRWVLFVFDIQHQVTDLFGNTPFGPFFGYGHWGGAPEESCVVTGLNRTPVSVSLVDARLTMIAKRYEQEAIAWSFGQNRLATP